jgi:hypothetical protein
MLKCAQISIELRIILNLLLQQLVGYLTQFLPGKLNILQLCFKVTYVTLVRKAADEIRITIFFKILRRKENKVSL